MKKLSRKRVFVQYVLPLLAIILSATAHSHSVSIDSIGQHELLYHKAQAYSYPYELVLAVYENSKTKRVFSRSVRRKSDVLVLPKELVSRYRYNSSCALEAEVNADVVVKYLMDLESEFGSLESALNEFYRSVSPSTKRFEYDRNGNSRFTNRVLSDFIKYQNDASLQAKVKLFRASPKINFADAKLCAAGESVVEQPARLYHGLSAREERIQLIRGWESIYDR